MGIKKKIVRGIAELLEDTGKQAVRRAGGAQIKRRSLKDVMAELPPELESLAVKRGKRRDTATVNIGLNPSTKEGGQKISRQRALQALRATGRRPRNVKVLQSGSEPTIVADIKPPLSARETFKLSNALRQDAVAQRTAPEGGMLAGPAASGWGEFNPAFFYTQEGDTLSSSLLTDKFRSGAPREDLTALADKWGVPLDPVNLSIMAQLRDEAAQRGSQLPNDLGVFTSRQIEHDPAALAAYRAGESFDPQGLQIGPAGALSEVGGRGVHIGRWPGVTTLDPSFYGRGHQGVEYQEARRRGAENRTHLYYGPEGTVEPELSVLGVIDDKMRQGDRYAYEGQVGGLYDIDEDPERITAMAKAAGMDNFDLEKLIRERGYLGYLGNHGPSWDPTKRRSAAVFGPVDVQPIDGGQPIDDWRRKFAVGGRVGCR